MPKGRKADINIPVFTQDLSKGTDQALVSKVTDEITKSWIFKSPPPTKPKVIMIGGFQGSGKTTTINLLNQTFDLAIVSPDEIRHLLFSYHMPFLKKFVLTLKACAYQLLLQGLATGHHVAIDQITTPERIDAVKKTLEQPDFQNYQLITVYLQAPTDELIRRVANRPGFAGKYKGTVEELKSSIKQHGQPDLKLYDLVINTEQTSPTRTVEMISQFLAPGN